MIQNIREFALKPPRDGIAQHHTNGKIMSSTDTKTMTTVAQVDVQSAWLSRINWTQAIGILASVITVVSGNKYSIPAETQLAIVATIQGVQGVVSWVLKTFFTKTITPSVAAATEIPTKDVMK